MSSYNPITETKNFIVLDEYVKDFQVADGYQTERELEIDFIKDLKKQGYEYRKDLTTNEEMLKNIRVQLEELNDVKFSDSEWDRFCEEYLNKPNDSQIDKTRKIHNDHIYDFIFDDGHIKNIHLIDKKNILRNKLQVISQFSQKGKVLNRYDVTILVNGLPLIQVELKKRGIAIREAFNQINRYSKESFNSENSL
ncbi:type I restriction endonuclease, partial [Fusobacterium mortiferum]|uniref:type I restriction endonuclease n=1 Tax=Fusobacterium mortiferum TaxID=850 RepID=UPI001DEBEFC0|nr:type I restriction endonuclease subunit R [Fusobacterium mortiferum]